MESFGRRLWARAAIAVLTAMASFALVGWFAWARPLVAQTMTQRLGYEVRLGQLYPRFRDGALVLVARDVVLMGRKPFHMEALALCDRVEIQPGMPPTIWVDGLEVRVLVAPRANNVFGLNARPRGGDANKVASALPIVHVRSGRLSAQVALPGGKRIALRAAETTFSNQGRAFDMRLGGVTVEVAQLITAKMRAVVVERTVEGHLLVHADNLRAAMPGGGALVDGLAFEGMWDDEGWSVSAQSSKSAIGQLAVHARAGAGGVSVQTRFESWPLAALAPVLDSWGVDTKQSHARGSFDAQLEPGHSAIAWQLEAHMRDFSLHHPDVDQGVWKAMTFAAEAQGRFDWTDTKLEVTRARLSPQGLPLDVSGWVSLGAQPLGHLSVRTGKSGWPCATLINHVAPSVRKALIGLQMRGLLDVAAEVGFDAANWDKLSLDLRLPATCEVSHEPDTLAANLHRLQTASAGLVERPELALASDHASFTPLKSIPGHVIAAFLTAEDAGFFLHKGFEPDNIRRALIYNIERGRLAHGASTITQQTAKNLFLSHDRTLNRKLVEAVLSWRLEQLVAKTRVLEMYLNLVELGPGIRGVGEAARAYFGKDPNALTPLEAAHIASLPPNPRGFARRFREGSVDEGWLARLYDLVGIMGRRGHLSPAQVATARGSRLRLRKI